MSIGFLTNLPPIGESVAKLASEGSQLTVDLISVSGFFAFCLLFVAGCLMLPPMIYEKYFKVEDDEPAEDLRLGQRETAGPAA